MSQSKGEEFLFAHDPILRQTFITSPPVLAPVVSINHNQQTMTSSQNSLPPGSRRWVFIRDLVFLVILVVALHVVFYVETHPGLSGSLWLVKVFAPEDSTDKPIFDVGFLITTPLYKILASSDFINDIFAGLNSLFIFMSLPYVLKVTFWQADYTLAFRVIATQLFRAFCGFFTFLPPSREFLPSYWDYPEAIYCVAGTMDCSIPPDRNNPAPFVTFFSGHVAMVVIIGNHMYTRGFRKSGVAMHVMNMMQVLR
jgi:hypothetical protein